MAVVSLPGLLHRTVWIQVKKQLEKTQQCTAIVSLLFASCSLCTLSLRWWREHSHLKWIAVRLKRRLLLSPFKTLAIVDESTSQSNVPRPVTKPRQCNQSTISCLETSWHKNASLPLCLQVLSKYLLLHSPLSPQHLADLLAFSQIWSVGVGGLERWGCTRWSEGR